MEDKPFNLKEYFPQARIERNAGNTGYELDQTVSGGLYEQIFDTSTSAAWIYHTEMDIGGWTREGLTAFFATFGIQRPYPYQAIGPVDPTQGGISIEDVIYITDVPIDLTDSDNLSFAGFMRAESNYMTIKFAEGTQRVQTINNPFALTLNDSWSFGSGEPTASGTLYCYRLIAVRKAVPTPQDTVDYPPLRWIGAGIATEEKEFVYLNRLRRSFELQQS